MKKIIFILYIFFLAAFTFFSYAFVDGNLFYLRLFALEMRNRGLQTMLYVFFLTMFFAFYALWFYLLERQKLTRKDILFLAIATCSILFFSYPAMLSHDIFNYLATAKVIFTYRENPYIVMPIEFVDDPLLKFMHAANKTALYGPSWLLLTGIPHVIGYGNFIATLFAFKGMMVGFYILMMIVVFRYTKSLRSVVFLALNPLVIIETIVSAHNDIVMVLSALLAFLLLKRRKFVVSCILMVFSVLVKYATLALVPFYGYLFFKNGRRLNSKYEEAYKYWFFSMLAMFLLSSLREEIYPWYALWFLTPLVFLPLKRNSLILTGIFSYSLMLRYVPFMISGTHFGITPAIKIIVTFFPVVFVVSLLYIRYHFEWKDLINSL
jgi:hypothetical protein